MRRLTTLVIVALAAVSLLAACGGGSNEPSSTQPSASGGGKPSAGASPDGSGSAGGGDSEVAFRGTLQDDPGAFISSVFGSTVAKPVTCKYDAARELIDCRDAGLGLIRPDPAPPTPVTECRALLLHDEMKAVSCLGPNPSNFRIYQVDAQ